MQEFYVDGTTIPQVDFDVGPSWSGLLPISGNQNETREVGEARGYAILSAVLTIQSYSFGFSLPVLREASMI